MRGEEVLLFGNSEEIRKSNSHSPYIMTSLCLFAEVAPTHANWPRRAMATVMPPTTLPSHCHYVMWLAYLHRRLARAS